MSYNYKPLYEDTDSVKVMFPPLTEEQRKQLAKCYLNAQYGTLINCKENKHMNREYIVVHPYTDGKAGIIFKDAINLVMPIDGGDFKTEIRTNGCSTLVTDSYVDVVKQLLK